VLVVDDFDLLGSSPYGGLGGGGGFGPLADLLPYGEDVALSVLVARRGGAAVRAGFDPGWQTLLELGASGLLLSGDPADGPVLGRFRARPQPPGRGLLVQRGRAARPIQVARPPRPAETAPVLGGTLLDLRNVGRERAKL
jgi:S-DNA-T family DNA segregation ATPase FtsK/SpoIIIE